MSGSARHLSARHLADRLAAALGGRPSVEEAFGEVTADVPAQRWVEALRTARDQLGLTYLDWLSAVDEADRGLSVVAHLVDPATAARLLVRTALPRDHPVLRTATTVFRGADWHERETAELFGVEFAGHPNPLPLLLPAGFAGYPLRKDSPLVARTQTPWPGASDPSDGTAGRPGRRRLPPGVPRDPAR